MYMTEGGLKSDEAWGRKTQVGGVAQLGEHLLCKQRVVSSILSASTMTYEWLNLERRLQETGDFEPGFSPAAAAKGSKFFDN